MRASAPAFYPRRLHAAALLVQCMWRGSQQRQSYKHLRACVVKVSIHELSRPPQARHKPGCTLPEQVCVAVDPKP